jgi:hypothetical protein
VHAVRRIAAVVVVAALAMAAVAEAREYLSFGEARYQVRSLIRADMKRNGHVYKEGSAEIACRRAPARLKDRAWCDASWLDTEGTSYGGSARVVKYRTYYTRHWRRSVCGSTLSGVAGLACSVRG